jgi:hypothetical protein
LDKGSDSNDASAPDTAHALETLSRAFDLAREIIRPRSTSDSNPVHVTIHAMGGGGIDPVDAPGEIRGYVERKIDIGTHDSYQSNITLQGPRSMIPISVPLHLVAATNPVTPFVTRLTFDSGVPNTAGLFLIMLRDDGREVYFPTPILEADPADNNSIFVGNISASRWIAAFADPRGATAYVATPGAWILADGDDRQFNSIHFVGNGAYRIGDRLGTEGQVFDPNPYDTISRMHLSRATFDVNGSVKISNTRLDDEVFFRGGEYQFGNCTAAVHMEFQGAGRFMTAASTYSAGEDPVAYMRSFALPLSTSSGGSNMDPEWPTLGADLVVTQYGSLLIGKSIGGQAGGLRITRGLFVVRPPSDTAISIFGPSSLFMGYGAVLYIKADLFQSPNVIGVWAKNGGQARLFDDTPDETMPFNIFEGLGPTNHLRVGRGASIGYSDLKSSTWSNYFTRRDEVGASGHRDDDTSVIWGSSWEPQNYWNGL